MFKDLIKKTFGTFDYVQLFMLLFWFVLLVIAQFVYCGQGKPAVFVVSLSMVAIAVYLFVWIVFYKLPQYKTGKYLEENVIDLKEYGIKCEKTKLTSFFMPKDLKNIVEWLVNFWSKAMGWNKDDIRLSLKDTSIKMFDKKVLDYHGAAQGDIDNKRNFDGLCFLLTKTIQISTKDVDNPTEKEVREEITSLLKHELSHIIVCEMGIYCDGEGSHKLFADKKLGA